MSMPSNHLILCHPLLLWPSIFPSIRVFSNESALRIRLLKYWSFSFRTSPSNDYSGLISFRINWFDLLAVQGKIKSVLQHHNLKALILWHSAFFMVQLSYHSFRECFKSVPYWPCYLPLTSSKNMASPCDHRGKDQIHKFKINRIFPLSNSEFGRETQWWIYSYLKKCFFYTFHSPIFTQVCRPEK